MNRLETLPLMEPRARSNGAEAVFQCVIESPRGSAVKIKYERGLDAFVMGVALPKGRTYPFDWGFLPSTLGEDGDPLDVMVIHDCSGAPGLIVRVHLIGVLEVVQRKHGDPTPRRNDRFFAVPIMSRRGDQLRDVHQLSAHLREELAQFFVETARLSDKQAEVGAWRGPDAAKALIDEGARRFAT